MAKKQRTKRVQKPVVEPKPQIDFEKVQAETLWVFEQYGEQAPRLNGVSVLQCCAYDVIQMLNGTFVAEVNK